MSPGISRLWLWRSQKHWKYDSIQSGENLSVNDDGDRNNGNALFYDDGDGDDDDGKDNKYYK